MEVKFTERSQGHQGQGQGQSARESGVKQKIHSSPQTMIKMDS